MELQKDSKIKMMEGPKKCGPLGQRETNCYVLYDPLFCECCDNVWKHYEDNDSAICAKCGAKYRDGNISILPLA